MGGGTAASPPGPPASSRPTSLLQRSPRPIFERLVDVARVGASTDEAAAAAHSFIADYTGSLTCTMPDYLIEFPLPS